MTRRKVMNKQKRKPVSRSPLNLFFNPVPDSKRGVVLFFFCSCRLIYGSSHFHTDRCFFHFNITAGAYLEINGAVFIYFIYRTMNTCDRDNLSSFLKIFNEFFLIFLFFRLRPDKKQPENKNDHPHKYKCVGSTAKQTAGRVLLL